MSIQAGWASCPKCQGMHFSGFPNKGACPAGGQHDETNSFSYEMTFDVPSGDHVQTGWASCPKCQGMHFAGFPSKGACPAGGQHDETNTLAYALTHDLPATQNVQAEWRACRRCQGLFFGPSKGVCPAGGQHSADGSFNYLAPFHGGQTSDTLLTFDTGPIDSDLALGGEAHIVVTNTGAWTITSHAHDSGFDNIDYTLALVLMSPSGLAFTFPSIQGGAEGTSAGLPFGTPRRDDPHILSGSNSAIRDDWERIRGSVATGAFAATDTLVAGVEHLIGDALKAAASKLGLAGATAVIALV